MVQRETITPIEMLRRFHHEVEGKSKGAIRKLASDMRHRYKLHPIKTAPRGFRYDPKEVDRKVPFKQLEPR